MPLYSAPSVNAFLDGILSQLPAGQNPYVAILASLGGSVQHEPQSVTYQLVALSAIFGLLNVLVIVSLIRKIGNEFWVFRLLRTSRGTYLHPHLSISWQLATVLFLTGLQPYVWGVYQKSHGKDVPFLTTFGPLTFWPSWLGGWLAMWALSVSKAALVTSSRGIRGVISSPRFMNAHFLVVPPLAFAAVATCCGINSRHFGRVFTAIKRISGELDGLASTWNPSTPAADIMELLYSRVAPGYQQLFKESDIVAGLFQDVWIVHFVLAAYLYLVITIVAFLHLKYLRETILDPLHHGTRSNSHHQQLRRSLIRLALAIISITGIGLSFSGLAGWLGFAKASLTTATASKIVRIQTLMSLWIFAVFGSIAAGMFFVQGTHLNTSGSSHDNSPFGSKFSKVKTPIEISVEVHRTTNVSRSENTHQREPQSFKLDLVNPQQKEKAAQIFGDAYSGDIEVGGPPRRERVCI